MSLQTGTEMVSLALLINKVTGLYGLLTVITGYRPNAVQLSMYIYSVLVLVLTAILLPHIRKQTPFQNLALAWIYIIDTAVNTAYTAAFAASWYVASGGNPAGDAAVQAPDTATSMVLIVALTLLRIYFGLVVMSFARQVLRRYAESGLGFNGAKSEAVSRNPFTVDSPDGEGWKGKVGRAMIHVGQEYWIGGDKEEDSFGGRTPLAAAVAGYDDDE